MTRDEVVALIVRVAREHDIDPIEFLGGAIAESALNPTARRPRDPAQDTASWPDVSFGLFQQTARWADEGDHSPRPDNIRYIEELYSDPWYASRVAAKKYKMWRGATATALDAWCRYNWPAKPPAENPNRANYASGLTEAARLLSMGGAAPSPTPAPPAPATYDPTYPAIPQNDDWSCAPTSLRWALHAFGRRPAEGWIEPAMIAAGVASEAVGLLDATGAGLAAFVVDEYGEFGYGAYSASPVLFDDIRAVAGRSPVLIGGRRWGAEGHWSGVRGYDAVRDVLLLANPADGYGGIHQTMSRQELAQRGPFSLVVLTHQGTPATPIPADPRDARISGLETALAHVCDIVVPRAAELQEEARRIRVQFLGEKP